MNEMPSASGEKEPVKLADESKEMPPRPEAAVLSQEELGAIRQDENDRMKAVRETLGLPPVEDLEAEHKKETLENLKKELRNGDLLANSRRLTSVLKERLDNRRFPTLSEDWCGKFAQKSLQLVELADKKESTADDIADAIVSLSRLFQDIDSQIEMNRGGKFNDEISSVEAVVGATRRIGDSIGNLGSNINIREDVPLAITRISDGQAQIGRFFRRMVDIFPR